DAPYPVYNGGCSNTGFYEQFNMEAPKVIMSARGAGAGFVNYINQHFWAGNSCYAISPKTNTLTIKYLYYYLKHNETAFLSNQQKGGIPAVSKKQVEDFSIPVPPLAEQQRIVDILDRFDKLTTDITAGLPAEIEARRKQYEYYRDQLLTFKQKAS
ncbi:MAG: restriction endonuclease subunit S, partial [Bacteroidales bacterium]|nr:restriction endonuclease subunit S [Bacteroidales bacterium]